MIEVGTYTMPRRGGLRIDAVPASRPSGAGRYTIEESVMQRTQVCLRMAGQLPLSANAAFTCKRDPSTAATLAEIVDPSQSLAAPGASITFSHTVATWQNHTSGSINDLYGVACPTSRTCYNACYAATIGSADGGQTWHALRSGTHADLQTLAGPDALTCCAVGAGGTILTIH